MHGVSHRQVNFNLVGFTIIDQRNRWNLNVETIERDAERFDIGSFDDDVVNRLVVAVGKLETIPGVRNTRRNPQMIPFAH